MVLLYCINSAFVILMPEQSSGAEMIITSDLQFAYAEELYVKKTFDTALHEYRRYLHFFPDSDKKALISLRISGCLYGLKRFAESEAALKELLESQIPETLRLTALYNLAEIQIAENKRDDAKAALDRLLTEAEVRANIVDDETVEIIRNAAERKKAWLFVEKGDWDKAMTLYGDMNASEKQTVVLNGFLSDLDEKKKAISEVEKDPAMAGLLSVIPGAGYLYLKRYQDASIAFLANALVIGGAYKAFDNGNAPLGVILSLIGSGFYGGNIYGSVRSADKHNENLRNAAISDLKRKYPENASPPVLFSFEIPF